MAEVSADGGKRADEDLVTIENVEQAFKDLDVSVEKAPATDKTSRKDVKSAQEGIDELKRKLAQEAEGRERETAARQEAERRANQANQDAFRARSDANATGVHLVDSAIAALRTSKAAQKEAYKQALAAQDFDRAGDLQEEMAASAARLLQLETAKQNMAAQPRMAPPQPIQSDPVEAIAYQLTPRSAAWVRAHPEYARDDRLRDKMIAAHNLAVADGFVADTDDYFREVEGTLKIKRMLDDGENDDGQAAQVVQRRSSPAAAPVSRSGSAPGSNPRVVRLTAEEREMAEMSNPDMAPEKAWQEYARNKVSLRHEGRLN